MFCFLNFNGELLFASKHSTQHPAKENWHNDNENVQVNHSGMSVISLQDIGLKIQC